MIVSRGNMRRIGWVAVLGICIALLFALSLRVNALKSEVRLTERQIVALQRERLYLETEFETRANQQQLENWNEVDFGYSAPLAGQYLESTRQLAAFGKEASPGAPAPIRVARAADSLPTPAGFPAMVSPLTGKPMGDDDADGLPTPVDHDIAAAALNERLGKLEPVAASAPAKLDLSHKTATKPGKTP